METMTITKPEDKQIIERTNKLQRRADAIQITDDESRTEAANFLKECAEYADQLTPIVDPPWRIALDAYEKIQKWRKDLVDLVKKPKTTTAAKIGAYDFTIEEKRRREAAIAEAKARKQAEEDRAAEIAAAKAAKDKEAVKALKEAPLVVAPIAPKTQAPSKVQGVSTRFEWKLDCIFNPSALPREFLIADESKIKARIKSLGGNHGIPGVKAVQVPVVSGRI